MNINTVLYSKGQAVAASSKYLSGEYQQLKVEHYTMGGQ